MPITIIACIVHAFGSMNHSQVISFTLVQSQRDDLVRELKLSNPTDKQLTEAGCKNLQLVLAASQSE